MEKEPDKEKDSKKRWAIVLALGALALGLFH
jgi:hypothetical protein